MSNKIAVLLNKEEQLTSFAEATWIYIYKKTSEWEVTQRIETKNLLYKREKDIKKFTLALIEKLECCKVIVGTLILGVPYYLLSRAGYELCEAATFSSLLLEQIYEDYCMPSEETDKKPIQHVCKSPVPVDDKGNYSMDMIAVQKAYPEMSSKKILLPFFRNTLFNSLKINCSHVMPWLENYLEQSNLRMSISRKPEYYTLNITHEIGSC